MPAAAVRRGAASGGLAAGVGLGGVSPKSGGRLSYLVAKRCTVLRKRAVVEMNRHPTGFQLTFGKFFAKRESNF